VIRVFPFLPISGASAVQLNRRTFDGAVAAKYAAIALLWFQYRITICTPVEILAGIHRHGFFPLKTTTGASDC